MLKISVWQNILNSSSEILHVGFLKKDLQTLATRRPTFNSFKVTVNTISFFLTEDVDRTSVVVNMVTIWVYFSVPDTFGDHTQGFHDQ